MWSRQGMILWSPDYESDALTNYATRPYKKSNYIDEKTRTQPWKGLLRTGAPLISVFMHVVVFPVWLLTESAAVHLLDIMPNQHIQNDNPRRMPVSYMRSLI